MSSLLEETVPSEVAELAVRIRELRNQRGWTLDELAKRAALSKSYLSRLEDAERQPSIAALLSLAQAFGISLAALFAPERTEDHCTIVRSGSLSARAGNGLSYVPLSGSTRAVSMQPIRITVPAERAGDDLFRHEGEEWLYVLHGTLRLVLGEDTYDLAPGDAAHFDARMPHRLTALHGQDVDIILVACAPQRQLLHSYL